MIDGATLDGVAATTLWTLRNRAVEAANPKSSFSDPLAVRLFDEIDYDYAKFGRPSQSHPLRAQTLDRALRTHLTENPGAPVVSLGEGLQTTFWRLGEPETTWLSVDLPAVVALRERLLPPSRITHVASSALDRSWMSAVPEGKPVFISAEGLLMYFDPADALDLIADCAIRFPGGRLFFDSIPSWLRDRSLKGLHLSRRYTAPPMPFSLSVTQARRLPARIPGVVASEELQIAPGHGLWSSKLLKELSNHPPLRDHRPSITLLTFASP